MTTTGNPLLRRRRRQTVRPLKHSCMRFVQQKALWFALLWSSLLSDINGNGVNSISGASFTLNGYDHPTGAKPICWQGKTAVNSTDSSSPTLVNPFQLNNNPNPTTPILLQSCPSGTQINARLSSDEKKLDSLPDGTWMGLTNVIYQYDVQGTIDISQWNANVSSSLKDGMRIGVSMILCSVEEVRFCTPFLHYETTQLEGKLGTLHGGSHIDTAVYQVPLIDSAFSLSVSVQVHEPGAFSIVAGAFFLYQSDDPTTNSSNQFILAGQVANIASDYPVIAFWNVQVSQPTRVAAYVLIAISGGVILFLLLSTLRHRKSQVMKLTQGNLLVAMLITALTATISSITFEPKNSVYCNLQGPLIILPLHILFSILVGRLWRIQAVVSPLLLLTLERKDTWSDKFVQWMRKITEIPHLSKKRREADHHVHNVSIMNSIRASWIQTVWKRKGDKKQPHPPATRTIRYTVTEGQLVRVVTIFCVPQIVVQILYLVFTRQRLNDGVCPTDFFESPTDGFGGVLLLAIVLLLLALARSAKDLPSLFNENEALWDVSLVSLVLLGVAFVVTVITHSPTTKPDIRYIVGTLIVVAITTNTCLKVMLPKLRKIWQKEKVVVTKLISDHNRLERTPLVVVIESSGEGTLEEGDEEAAHMYQQGLTRLDTPSHPGKGKMNGTPQEGHDEDGYESEGSSVVLICLAENEIEPYLGDNSQSDLENSMSERHESLEAQRLFQAVDIGQNQADDSKTTQSLRRNSYGLPSRSSLLSSSSYNIPENASVSTTYNERFPSFAGSVPESEPTFMTNRNGNARMSRMHHRRGHQPSIVRNRKRISLSRSNHGSFVSQKSNDNNNNNSTPNNGARFSTFRPPKCHNAQLLDIGYNPKRKKESVRIVVGNPEEPPPRRLLLRMIDVQHTLSLVNRAILSGDQVAQEDWEFLREAVVALGQVFEQDVQFDWEPTQNSSFTVDVPVLGATQSAPFARGSFQLSPIHQMKPPSFSPSVSAGVGEENGRSTSQSSAIKTEDGPVPFSRDRFIGGGGGGGRVISGFLHNLPRKLSREGLVKRLSTLTPASPNDRRSQPQKVDSPNPRRRSIASAVADDDKQNDVDDENDDDEAPSQGSASTRTRRVLPRSGRSFPRSRFKASGVSTSLQTIQSSLSESITSNQDSGLASSGLFMGSDENFAPDVAAIAEDDDAVPPLSELGLPAPPLTPPQASTGYVVQLSMLSDDSNEDRSQGAKEGTTSHEQTT